MKTRGKSCKRCGRPINTTHTHIPDLAWHPMSLSTSDHEEDIGKHVCLGRGVSFIDCCCWAGRFITCREHVGYAYVSTNDYPLTKLPGEMRCEGK